MLLLWGQKGSFPEILLAQGHNRLRASEKAHKAVIFIWREGRVTLVGNGKRRKVCLGRCSVMINDEVLGVSRS